jgi:FKBP-type peptidyl-prolyl cis-trans isomerase FklB
MAIIFNYELKDLPMKLKTLAMLPILLAMPVLGNTTDLKTDEEKLSYIFGIQVGQGLKQEGIKLEMDAFAAGVEDMMAENKPKIDQATAQKLVEQYQAKKQAELAEMGAKKQKEANDFLAKNAQEEGVVVTASGLQYKIIEAGKGKSPASGDQVVAHYTGKLLDGTVFDSSHDRGKPATFPVSGVIKGWQEALPLMKEGGKWQLVIPANLAYGERGAGAKIGPNEALMFDIELVSIESTKTIKK